jgi:hypothetical protein
LVTLFFLTIEGKKKAPGLTGASDGTFKKVFRLKDSELSQERSERIQEKL